MEQPNFSKRMLELLRVLDGSDTIFRNNWERPSQIQHKGRIDLVTDTDLAIEESNLRRVMFTSSKKRILLCDSSKFGKRCFYNMGSVREIDGIISDAPLPDSIAEMMKR